MTKIEGRSIREIAVELYRTTNDRLFGDLLNCLRLGRGEELGHELADLVNENALPEYKSS